jgi:polar amino acid transport system substrate-binding protein
MTMPKLHRFLLPFLLASTLWGGITGAEDENGSVRIGHELNLTKREQTYLKKHPVLRVHNESNWPPFNFNENGIPRGFSVDYMRLLADRLGIELRFVSGYTWEEFLKMLPTDKLDAIINIAPTDERAKAIAFTRPYISVRNAIYTNLNNQIYYSLDDLKGKKVALPKDFFIQRYLAKHYPQIRQTLVKDQLEALQLLSFGKVDAVIGKQVVVDYLLREHLLSNIIATSYVNDPGTLSQIAIGVGKKDALLAGILDKAQQTVSKAEMDRLRHKWFGINALLDTRTLLKEEEIDYLRKKKAINICIETDRAPIEYLVEKRPKGIAVDTINIIAKRLGMQTRFVETRSWEQTEELLRERHCDLLPATLQTRRNRSLLLFTRPYFSYETIIVARKEISKVDGLRQFEGKTMAARWDTPLTERLQESHPDIRILEYGSYAEAFEAVENGKADFVLTTHPIYDHYRRRLNLPTLHIVGTAPIRSDLSIAVRKNELTLFTIINKILEALPKETFKAINDKWTQRAVVKEMDWLLLFKYLAGAGFVLLIILGAYLKQRRLSRKIRELNNTLEERVAEALERNRQQQLLMLHRDRLANMGEMIAMIAHQWRQPLNNLSLLNQLLITKYRQGKLDDELIEYFGSHSRKQIHQMSQTIDDFRNFYKPEREKQKFCIEEVLRQLIDLVNITYASEKIEIVYSFEGCNYFVGYPNEFSHAVLNIMNNARDALIEKDFGSKKIYLNVREEGEEILVEICDNAGGIPEEILPRVFDPYFSTKNEKNGTGLGLYMTNVIITEHMESKISVKNREEGACFTIYLRRGRHV